MILQKSLFLWFDAQETFLIIINVENSCASVYSISVETVIFGFYLQMPFLSILNNSMHPFWIKSIKTIVQANITQQGIWMDKYAFYRLMLQLQHLPAGVNKAMLTSQISNLCWIWSGCTVSDIAIIFNNM